MENRGSKVGKNITQDQNKIVCHILKSKNKEFNSLMSVLELKYKDK